jgi:hypothetical protein
MRRELHTQTRDSAHRSVGPGLGDEQDRLSPATAGWPGAAGRHPTRGGIVVEDGRSRDLAYPRRMSDIPQLLASIDSRLADLAAEITALETAKGALDGPHAVDPSPAGGSDAMTARSRPRSRRPRRTPSATPTAPVASGTTSEPVVAPRDDGSDRTPKRATRKAASKATQRRRAGVAVRAETLEHLLADTSAGLSANVFAERAGAGYNPTLKLLRELEAAGEVRRSGSRRSTVWRLVTDEERIAERAAEHERRSGMPSQRRRRGRRARSAADQEPSLFGAPRGGQRARATRPQTSRIGAIGLSPRRSPAARPLRGQKRSQGDVWS